MSMSMLMSIVRNTLPVVVVLISCVAPLARCQRSEGNNDSSVLLNAAAVLAVFHSIVAVTNLHTESRQIKMMASPTRVWRSLATTALLHFRTCGSAAPVLVHRIDSAICQMAHVRKCTSVKTTSEQARERESERFLSVAVVTRTSVAGVNSIFKPRSVTLRTSTLTLISRSITHKRHKARIRGFLSSTCLAMVPDRQNMQGRYW